MKTITPEILRSAQNDKQRGICKWLLPFVTVFWLLSPVFCCHSQCTFSSDSTGSDGDFNPPGVMPTNSGWSVSNDVSTGNSIITVTNKPDGIFNFGSIYIETNWVVRFTKNALNTPVYLLATNNVMIKGRLDLDGQTGIAGISGGVGGPGGFDGGTAAGGGFDNGSGFGPGGGQGGQGQEAGGSFGTASSSDTSKIYGTLDIQPFIGGSGGSGSTWTQNGGGGGGGALLLASSTLIDISGTITASGAEPPWPGPVGSGGAIKLITPTLQGEGVIRASTSIGRAGTGRIRIETCSNQRFSLTDPPATYGPPGAVFPNPNPTIRVTSIAGVNIAWPPGGLLTKPDTNLPSGFQNSATITVSANNISNNTPFKVIVAPDHGTNIVATGTLSGSYASSSGSVTMDVYTDRVFRVNALIDYIPRP